MSDIESRLFVALEWQRDVSDIREQFPLFDRGFTQQVARELKVAHPYYPQTHVPVVMTVDFMVTKVVSGKEVMVAYDAKDEGALNDLNTLNKLEITREALALMGVQHHLVLDTSIPRKRIDNIEWIQLAAVREGEVLPRPNYFEDLKASMESDLLKYRGNLTLSEYCRQFEEGVGLPRGTGLRVAKLLMLDRTLVPDLNLREIEKSLVKEMTITARFGNLRAVA
ncbi:heteromeric transposase endonuclease subunit TnsA [Hydrogenophaga flava]|uniref:heteromeric transposase endonuclease subunit TnsA n=1 Tax=Hydrogenophaga flava TaxID=65657 RepID=UPI00082662E1|nr:heteromeric transposase endonuclease subunit TnsA [Hydrogenophaga flava]